MSKVEIITNLQQARCIKVTSMVDMNDRKIYCLRCSVGTGNTEYHALVFKHYCVKGTYNCRCIKCNKDLTTTITIDKCALCQNNCAKVLHQLAFNACDINRVTYCLDNYDLTFERINLNV